MDRNFFRRIEACFPVLDKKLKKRVLEEGLKIYLKDNCQAWEMDCNGFWHRKSNLRGAQTCAQAALMELLGQTQAADEEA
jgi:polyphosphate kinase